MPGMPWVKLYTEILDDVKILRLSDAQKWRFIQLILFAAECDADGALVTGDSPVTHEDVSIRLRCDIEIIEKDIEKLTSLGLAFVEDGVIIVTNFSQRQGPTQEEKRKQWRERQRNRRARVKKSPVTHGGVTPLEEEEEKNKEEEEDSHPLPLVYPNSSGEALKHPDLQLVNSMCGVWPGAYDWQSVIDSVRLLQGKYPRDQDLVEYITPFWTAWSSRKTKNGQPYKATNFTWLTEWAVFGQIPAQTGEGKAKSSMPGVFIGPADE